MFYILLFIFVLLSNNRLSNTQTLPFDTIVSFGDGNSDTGNVYNLTDHQWPLVPPYYPGCFTNGPVWIQKLNLSKIMNYAYEGATIDNDNSVVGFTPFNHTRVPGVRQQILIYLTNNDLTTLDLSRTLYVIWAGGNDYIDNSSLSADFIAATLINAVYDLVLVGVKHLLIMNQPPLQAYPFAHQSDNYVSLGSRIIAHNNYLSLNITQINAIYARITIDIFDLYSLINTILSSNLTLNFNRINKCWNIMNCSVISQCTNPNQYVFIDNYHLTTSIHQSIANGISKFYSISSANDFSLSKLLICIFIIVFIIKEN